MPGLIGGSIGFGLSIILRLELALSGFIPFNPYLISITDGLGLTGPIV